MSIEGRIIKGAEQIFQNTTSNEWHGQEIEWTDNLSAVEEMKKFFHAKKEIEVMQDLKEVVFLMVSSSSNRSDKGGLFENPKSSIVTSRTYANTLFNRHGYCTNPINPNNPNDITT
mmetsp:Transcript_76381/g.214265  ORF Transcript_76381/g.214265 Transcript_76381/m.214265 type:complete len:116 (+) Transcript_76381:191-538(+)